MASPKLSLKLLIDVKAQKVVFAEAEKDFVDFLFYLLSLPVGNISGLLNQGMVGCMGNLYQSVKTLNINYVQSNISKDSLLKPAAPTSAAKIPQLFPDNSTLAPTKFYSCSSCHRYVSNATNVVCPECFKYMLNEVTCVSPNLIGEGGYVKGLVTYMVTDDLSVMPMSMISGISIMNNSNISGFDSLEQKKVEFGMDEALKLLKASLQTKEALTCVFLSQKGIKNVTAT